MEIRIKSLDGDMKSYIYKRTFEAKNYPEGSRMRALSNQNSVYSEYMPSNKFVVRSDILDITFRTKKEAIEFVKSKGGNWE